MPAKWLAKAIATPFGYASIKNGEILMSRRDLTPAAGASGYKRNQPGWMRTYVGTQKPTNTVAPAVTGTGTVGQTLTTTNGTWTGATATYTRRWLRDGVAIAGATGLTYVLVAGDSGKTIKSEVTATNTFGTVVIQSNGVAVA